MLKSIAMPIALAGGVMLVAAVPADAARAVVLENVNLRSGPSTSSRVVGPAACLRESRR